LRDYIQAGRYDRALDLIEPLLSNPGDITAGWLLAAYRPDFHAAPRQRPLRTSDQIRNAASLRMPKIGDEAEIAAVISAAPSAVGCTHRSGEGAPRGIITEERCPHTF
jgi:hypothetical protein